MGLHLLGEVLVLEGLGPFLTELVDALSEHFLDCLLASVHGLELVHPAVHVAGYHIVVDGERVYPRLHQEQLRFEHAFQHAAAHIGIVRYALSLHILDFLLEGTDGYHLVAYHGNGLVDESRRILLGACCQRRKHQTRDGQISLHINK